MQKNSVLLLEEQVCVKFPKDHIIEIDNLIQNHDFDSRSSLIRKAVKEFLDKRKILS